MRIHSQPRAKYYFSRRSSKKDSRDTLWIFCYSRWDRKEHSFASRTSADSGIPLMLARCMNGTYCLCTTFFVGQRERKIQRYREKGGCGWEERYRAREKLHFSSFFLHKHKIEVCGGRSYVSFLSSSNKYTHQLNTFFRNSKTLHSRISRNNQIVQVSFAYF